MTKKIWKNALIASCMIPTLVFGTPVFANTSAAGQVEVKVKIGVANATVNGSATPIEKPYATNTAKMIPLSLLTSAFGAKQQWDNQTQTITVSYGGKSMTLKAGNKNSTVNGKAVALPAAPEIKNGKTMVPIAVATQLGITVTENAQSGEIMLVGASQESNSQATTKLDSDLGKTKIGDSYMGWSMKYPTGLIKSYQSHEGDQISFKDNKDSYWLDISIFKDQPENMSNDGLVKWLTEDEYYTILSKGYVTEGSLSYAKSVTKDEDGYISENRAYKMGDKIFHVMLTVKDEADYKNPAKYRSFKDLLDSFVTSYNQADHSIKDLSNVENGYRWFDYEDFGLRVKVPVEWIKNDRNDYAHFYSEDHMEWLRIKVSSYNEGDTLDDWVAKHEQLYRELFVDKYLEVDSNIETTTVAGVTAKEREYETPDGVNMYPEHDIYLYKGKYKFYIEIGYNKNEDPAKIKARINTIKNSLSINEAKMNPSLGTIQDDDLFNRENVITVKDSKYKYSIDVPEYWKEDRSSNGEGFTTFVFDGGNFNVFPTPESYSEVRDGFLKILQEEKSEHFSIVKNERVTIQGVEGTHYVFHFEIAGVDIVREGYIFRKGKYTYLFGWNVKEVMNTEVLKKRIENALNSFKVLE